MFATSTMARRIESAETSLSTDLAEAVGRRGGVDVFSIPFFSGAAVFTGADSPITKVIGVGLQTVPDPAALDELEARFFAYGCPVRFEVAILADPALAALLTTRGYVLEGFENVLGRTLDAADAALPPSNGIDVLPPRDLREWRDVIVAGFSTPDTGVASAPGEPVVLEAIDRIFADMATAQGMQQYVARIGDDTAGGGGIRIHEGLAQLAGAATAPAFRRRGVQTALLRARLRAAAQAGCDLAVVTTQPGSKSQENVQRAGFELLYTRAVLVKKAPPAAGA